jgi:hypothetical protein
VGGNEKIFFLLEEMFFKSYKEAHEVLKLPGSWQRGTQGNKTIGISSLKITNNPNSLDKMSNDLSHVFYVGIGKKSSQGEPAAHQRKEDQEPFFVSKRLKKKIPILIKLASNTVFFAGYYQVKAVREKTSPKGFVYYEIVLESLQS